MKLIVFGATGGTGLQVVRQALSQGHDVSAFTRGSAETLPHHDKLSTVRGDVLDYGAVERAVPGHDAVMCTLGSPPTSREQLRTKGTQNIIQAMEKAGIRRIVCQSALGVGESRKLLPVHYKWFIVPLFLRKVYADHEGQESCVQKSGLDWIIVRCAILTDGERTGKPVQVSLDGNRKIPLKISRTDAARFMLDQLSDNSYLHGTPCISC